jgi:hypothetical protein
MQSMSIRTKIFGAVAAAALLSLATVVPAHAANTDTNNDSTTGFTVNGGTGPRFDPDVPADQTPIVDSEHSSNALPEVQNFSDVTMNGQPQLTSAVVPPFTIIDDSGTGAGWHVTFTLPDFTDGGTNTVDASAATMNAAVMIAGTPGSDLGGMYTSSAIDFTAGQTIVTADPGNWALNPAPGADTVDHGNGDSPVVDGVHVAGMGTYLISPQIVKLVVPVNTHAATYTTTANFTISSGP